MFLQDTGMAYLSSSAYTLNLLYIALFEWRSKDLLDQNQ